MEASEGFRTPPRGFIFEAESEKEYAGDFYGHSVYGNLSMTVQEANIVFKAMRTLKWLYPLAFSHGYHIQNHKGKIALYIYPEESPTKCMCVGLYRCRKPLNLQKTQFNLRVLNQVLQRLQDIEDPSLRMKTAFHVMYGKQES